MRQRQLIPLAVLLAGLLLILVVTAALASGGDEEIKLLADDGAAEDEFGVAVDLDGDTAIVGAYLANVELQANQGAAYIFERDLGGPGMWGQVVKLVADDGLANDTFGVAVALDGDTAVVGAAMGDGETISGTVANSGAAYVFERDAGGPDAWGQVAKLSANDGATDDWFGISVAIDGDTIVVGAFRADVDQVNQGAAYVYERDAGGAGNWGQVQKLTVADGAQEDQYGSRVAVQEDTLIVGAFTALVADQGFQGAAYIYARMGDLWEEQRMITAEDGLAVDLFGWSLDLDQDTVVVGAFGADVEGQADQGAAYVFYRDQGGADNWGQVQKLIADDGAQEDNFGWDVSIDGTAILVGALAAEVGTNANQGAAYLFGRDLGAPDAWGQALKLTASDGLADDQFGSAVTLQGEDAIVSAWSASVGSNVNQGAAYVWRLDVPPAGLVATNDSPTVPGQPTTLTATLAAGTNVTFSWSFGDGQSGSGAVVTHVYPASGPYTATVTATNESGLVTAATVVTISDGVLPFRLYLPIGVVESPAAVLNGRE